MFAIQPRRRFCLARLPSSVTHAARIRFSSLGDLSTFFALPKAEKGYDTE
jgi:hypothetical protein